MLTTDFLQGSSQPLQYLQSLRGEVLQPVCRAHADVTVQNDTAVQPMQQAVGYGVSWTFLHV